MKAILALDQGTTSSRAIVFDSSGSIVAVAQKELRQIYPRPGWVEHDPHEIASTQIEVAAEVVAKVPAVEIAAIGITNQRETTMLWDRATGEPIANAIVWQDRRTAPLCEQLREYEPLFRERTGLVLDPYFSGTKIRWLLDNVGGKRLAFGTVDTWLIWKLTKGRVHVTDVTNASRTLLFNIHTGEWDDDLLRVLKIPREILPTVVSSSGVVGETAEGIPIAGIAGDQQAALFGQRCIKPGMVKNTYGTGCFMLMHTGSAPIRSRAQLLTTAACQTGAAREYALEGSVFIAGAVVQWLRDGLGIIRKSADVEALAKSVPDNGGAYFVPAFAGLGSPHWDPYARGAIVGLTRGTGAGHIARAALEAIAYQTADVLAAMESDSGIRLKELRVDGGAAGNDMLMQFQADLLGVPVVRPKITETTALGAAYLAGLGTGFWRSAGALDAQWQVDRVFEPKMERGQAQVLLAAWHKAVERSKDWERRDK